MLIDRSRKIPWFVVLALAAGCSGGGGSPGNTAPPAPAPTPTPLALTLSQVGAGVASPVFLTSPSGDARQFIVERAGRIRIMQGGVLLPVPPFLDISARVSTAGEAWPAVDGVPPPVRGKRPVLHLFR